MAEKESGIGEENEKDGKIRTGRKPKRKMLVLVLVLVSW
jgi:hypothetical protein